MYLHIHLYIVDKKDQEFKYLSIITNRLIKRWFKTVPQKYPLSGIHLRANGN